MANRYWVGGTASWDAVAGTKWATTSGGAGGAAVPTSADDVFFDANSTGTVTATSSAVCHDLDCRNFAGSFTNSSDPLITIYGSLNTGTTDIGFGWADISFAGTTSGLTITTNGTTQTWYGSGGGAAWNFNGVGGEWTLQDNLTMSTSSACAGGLSNGTFNLNGFTVTCGNFNISGSNTRVLTFGSGGFVLYRAGGGSFIWNATTTTNLTLNPDTGFIKIVNDIFTPSPIFVGGGLTYPTLWLSLTTSGVVGQGMTIQGSNTFTQIKNDSLKASVMKFTAGTTQTVGSLDINGVAPYKYATLESTTSSAFTITDTSGTNDCNYVLIRNSTANGGATFRALPGSVDGGGNTGWLFPGYEANLAWLSA